MQMIHPLQAGAARPMPVSSPLAPQQQAARSKMRARQQRILRTALLLLGSASLICFLLLWRTDMARLALAQRALDGTVAALQSRVDELGWLPGALTEAEAAGIQAYVVSTEGDRRYAMQSGEPAIIGVSRRVPLLLGFDGHYVILYNHGKLHTEWMTSSRYEAARREQVARIRTFEEQLLRRPPELP